METGAGVTNSLTIAISRRATGYPGPGIIPSDTRTFYTTLDEAAHRKTL
jgi:Fe(3+) dicitrate transport protein